MQKFKTLEEADEATYAYYRSLTPSERLSIYNQLLADAYGPGWRMERGLRIFNREGQVVYDSHSGRPIREPKSTEPA